MSHSDMVHSVHHMLIAAGTVLILCWCSLSINLELISCTLMGHFTFTSSASAALAVGWDEEHAGVGVLLTARCALLQAV